MADDQPGHEHRHDSAATASPDKAIDPVCGMSICRVTSGLRIEKVCSLAIRGRSFGGREMRRAYSDGVWRGQGAVYRSQLSGSRMP